LRRRQPRRARTPKPAKAQKSAKAAKSEGVREGSKTAQVVALLKRENGATLAEIMEKMAWQKHTVRGFMAGAMKKARPAPAEAGFFRCGFRLGATAIQISAESTPM
jgi:hypothetical protein